MSPKRKICKRRERRFHHPSELLAIMNRKALESDICYAIRSSHCCNDVLIVITPFIEKNKAMGIGGQISNDSLARVRGCRQVSGSDAEAMQR